MEKKMTKKALKALDARVNALYPKYCHGLVVSIWDLGKIAAVGRAVALTGGDDAAIGEAMRAFTLPLAKNADEDHGCTMVCE